MKLFLLIFLFVFNFAPFAEANGLRLSAPVETVEKKPESNFLTPLKKQLVKWNILINKEIPKRMKELKDNPTPAIIIASIMAAMAYGILHTLGPGHGKTVVASYFLTNGTKFWRGAFVGAQVAFSHVAGSVFLVFATDLALGTILTNPEEQIFWMRAISFSLIIVLGCFMLFQAFLHMTGKGGQSSCCSCNAHQNSVEQHSHRSKKESILSWCVGLVPCTGSLLILLYAMANDILWLGILMVVFVALGMALTMTIIGIICIYGKKQIIDRITTDGSSGHSFKVWLEIAGAAIIISIGSLLLYSIIS